AMRATGSCATPTPRPSWLRPRSSWRRCSRCWRAERAGHGVPHAPVQLDIGLALGADFDDARAIARQGTLESRPESGQVLDALVREPIQRRRVGEVQPGWG